MRCRRSRSYPTGLVSSDGGRRQQGFTLVEVLIASLILFSAIVVGTLAMRTSLNQLRQISSHARTASALTSVRGLVRTAIHERRLEGKAAWGSDLPYEWKAEAVASARDSVGLGSMEEMAEQGRFRLTLYLVTLTLGDTASGGRKPRSVQYKELVCERAP